MVSHFHHTSRLYYASQLTLLLAYQPAAAAAFPSPSLDSSELACFPCLLWLAHRYKAAHTDKRSLAV